jgi:imidazolonepropionase-like amidohydrolase
LGIAHVVACGHARPACGRKFDFLLSFRRKRRSTDNEAPGRPQMFRRHSATFVLAALALLAAQPASAQTVLFEHARVIPGDGRPAIDDAALLVERGMITGIGRAGDIVLPAGGTRIDLAGKTVMPAMISTHVHPGFQKGLSYRAENFTRENILADLDRELYAGVSTVMSLGIETGDVMFQIRADQAQGRAGGARLLLAGRGIGAPNAGPGNDVYAYFAYAVTTEDEIRRAVREQAARKVDIIKIWVDDRGGRAPRIPIPLALAAIDEAHKHGLKIAAHIFYHDDAVALAQAGIDAFAHLVRDREMSDELIALMLKNKVYVMPTLGSTERSTHSSPPAWVDEPYLAGLLRDMVPAEVVTRIGNSFAGRDPADVARRRQGYAILERSFAKLSAAGAAILLGCDTGLEDNIFGYAEQRELELMVAAGMSPSQAIVAATSRAAEFVGLPDRGTLAPGKRADLLVLDADSLDDIRNTRRIAKLYLAGAEVDRAAIRQSLASGGRN